MAEYRDELLDHDYDGIRELDNDLPRWWLWLFYLTIIFSILYLIYYHVLGVGYTSDEEYQSEINPSFMRVQSDNPTYFGIIPKYQSPLAVRAQDKIDVKPAAVVSPGFMTRESDTTIYVAMTDEADIAAGKNIYITNCASCHGNLGEGGVGPNLADDYWLHGNSFTDIVKTIRYGYPTKGMIAWLGQLSPNDIIRSASFVETLKGTNPPNPKAPEGEMVADQ